MSRRSVSALARVTVTVEIETGAQWGSFNPLDQLYEQAHRETIAGLTALLDGLRTGDVVCGGVKRSMRARLVGEPKVEAIVFEEADR